METARDTAISSDASIPEDAPAPAERRVLQPVLFLDYVQRFAEAAEAAIRSLRLIRHYEVPRLEELIAPGVLQEGISVDSFRNVLCEYFSTVNIAGQLPISERRKKSADPLTRNASEWDGDVALWQQRVYTAERQHIDALVEQLEKEAQAWQKPVEECSVRMHRLIREMYNPAAQGLLGVPFNGLLAGAFKTFQKKLYAEAGLRHQDNPEQLYALCFKACAQIRGWDKLSDEPLVEVLEQEQVPLQLFEEYTGKKIKLSKKNKPETVQEVIADVQKKAERHFQSGSGSFAGELILMPQTSTYPQGVYSLQATCKNEPNSPHRTFTRADGIIVYRPFTFHENLLACVTDFDTLHDASGAKRSLADRLRFFNRTLDSCTGVAYEAGTDRMKIISPCAPLIAIAPDFSDGFLAVPYASLDGYELDRSQHAHSTQLEKDKVLADPYWLAAVEEDEVLLKKYTDIVFSLLLEKYDLTKGMGFFPRRRTTTDELRALFVRSLDDDSGANGDISLYNGGSFLRVAPSSDAPAGRRA